MTEELNAWCSLWRAPGVGVKTYHTLLEIFGSPEAFFRASITEICERLPGVKKEKIVQWKAAENTADADLKWLQGSENRHIVCWADDFYPPLLRETADPPPLLFVCGEPSCLQMPQIALVGSRNAGVSALRTCHDFARSFAASGLIVTSGLALGVDAAAHEGALQSGQTIAVVGTGLDRVYPARHRELAHRIVASGALVSEFPIGTGVRAGHFPRRNRIISALSLGVLVIEASLRSGSLITARLAVEQGREVFAVPGSIHNPLAKGCHRLIKEGAKLAETAEDVLEELYPLALAGVQLAKQQHLPVEEQQSDAHEHPLLQAMGYDICSADELVERLQLTSAEISAMLLMLELDGCITALPGGLFRRSS